MNYEALRAAYDQELVEAMAEDREPDRFALDHCDPLLARQYLAGRRERNRAPAQFTADDVLAGINRLRRAAGEDVEPGQGEKVEVVFSSGKPGTAPLKLKCFSEGDTWQMIT